MTICRNRVDTEKERQTIIDLMAVKFLVKSTVVQMKCVPHTQISADILTKDMNEISGNSTRPEDTP